MTPPRYAQIRGAGGTPCFLLERIPHKRRWLRRYLSIDDPPAGTCDFHDAFAFLDDVPDDVSDEIPHEHELWPTACEACGYEFGPEDEWDVFTLKLYWVISSIDEGYVPREAIFHIHANMRFEGHAPAGAMWDASWLTERIQEWDPANPWHVFGPGSDGRLLEVRLPGRHDWIVDSRASNCGKPTDNEHRCWVRVGDPPNVTVSKDGLTCAAGAGSIQAGSYHGFLQNGRLT